MDFDQKVTWVIKPRELNGAKKGLILNPNLFMVIIQCFQILSDGQFTLNLLFFEFKRYCPVISPELDRIYPNTRSLFGSFLTRCYVTFHSVTVKVTCHCAGMKLIGSSLIINLNSIILERPCRVLNSTLN